MNAKDSINENYARELLELHTLGKDGGYSEADMKAAFNLILALDPKPGASQGAPAEAAIPDVIVSGRPGAWKVELNTERLPRVRVNNAYERAIATSALYPGPSSPRARARARIRSSWLGFSWKDAIKLGSPARAPAKTQCMPIRVLPTPEGPSTSVVLPRRCCSRCSRSTSFDRRSDSGSTP